MNLLELITAKRDGAQLTATQIQRFIQAYTRDELPDYQVAALLMAIYFQGLNDQETADLTSAMLESGRALTWDDDTPMVDKHSTGGVGDKVSLVLAPLLACCDVRIPMISGRGLGPTGGTLDKLQSIEGLRTDLSLDELRRVIADVGCVITGTTPEIAPADRKLYALRDVTATVESIGLIVASIMSKKLAETLNALVLDVKVGTGAFMRSHQDAVRLAQLMVEAGKRVNVATVAYVTDMNQPLGQAVGNAIEIQESVRVLQGQGPEDVRELSLVLGAELLVQSGRQQDRGVARSQLISKLDSGEAFAKWEAMILAQGGHPDRITPLAPAGEYVTRQGGRLVGIDARRIGMAITQLGGGRLVADQPIDYGVGLRMDVRLGDILAPGQRLFTLYGKPTKRDAIARAIEAGMTIVSDGGDYTPPPLVHQQVR